MLQSLMLLCFRPSAEVLSQRFPNYSNVSQCYMFTWNSIRPKHMIFVFFALSSQESFSELPESQPWARVRRDHGDHHGPFSWGWQQCVGVAW